MSNRYVSFAAAALAAASALAAQSADVSWGELVRDRWPGSSIRKVSEAEFHAFVKQHGSDDVKSARKAFLRVQYEAYGLTAHDGVDFPVPDFRAETWRPTPGTDAIVMEGAEPNNDPLGGGTPTPINIGDEGHGNLSSGDDDWWSFSAPATYDAKVWVSPGVGSPPDDVQLTIFDSTGTLVAYNDDYHRYYSQVTFRMQGGVTYYASVAGFTSTDVGDYTIDVTGFLVTGAPGSSFGRVVTPENPEPNDNAASATPLSCNEIGTGLIAAAGDADWYGPFPVPSGGLMLTARVDPPMVGNGELYDSEIDIVDQTGALIATDDDSGPRYLSRVAANVAGGTYYVVVRGFGNTEVGDYSVYVECGTPLAVAAEGPEPNNSPLATPAGTPTNIAGQSIVTGNINVVGDQDWYRVVATRGTLLYATTDEDPNAAMQVGDSILTLYDAQGVQLYTNDDYDGGHNYSRVEVVVPAGTYYLAVSGYQSSRGAYTMTLESRSGFGGVLYNSGGCVGSNGTPLIYPRFSSYGGESFEAPAIGSTFSLSLAGLPANGLGVVCAGLSNTNYLAVPLPFNMGILGAPGCIVETSLDFQSPVVADAQGDALWSIPVPYLPVLNGAFFFVQTIVLDQPANNLGLTVSNSVECVIGNEVHFRQYRWH